MYAVARTSASPFPAGAIRASILVLASLACLAVGCKDGGSSRPADLDLDGIPDRSDPDIDGDGVLNVVDAFPRDPLEFHDADGNGIGNLAQADEDGDGVLDLDDAFPFDATRSSTAVWSEVEFNDNLGAANSTSVALVGREVPPADFSPVDRFVRIRGAIGLRYDADIYLVAPPPGVPVTFVVRALDPARSIDGLHLGLVDLAGVALPLIPIPSASTALLRWVVAPDQVLGLVVNDLQGIGSSTFEYEITMVVDADHDGLGDDRELALGGRTDTVDSEGDGVTDFDEVQFLSAFDSDADRAPNWLDRDADGDGVLDHDETGFDTDGDGLPNLADADADGNGIADAAEPAYRKVLLDFDRDGVADAFDLDDDDDGLEDRVDPAVRGYATTMPTTAGTLLAIRWSLLGRMVDEVARPGATLELTGQSLGADPAARFEVQFPRGADRRGRRWVSAVATAGSTAEVLTVTVPSEAITGEVRLVDTASRQLTYGVPLRMVGERDVVLLDGAIRAAPGQTVLLNTLSNPAAAEVVVQINDVAVIPSSVGTGRIVFTLPANAEPGLIRVATPRLLSNAIPLTLVTTATGEVRLPNGSPIANRNLTLSAGASVATADIGTNRTFTMSMLANAHGVVSVSLSGTGTEAPVLFGLKEPQSPQVALNVQSTAEVLVWFASELRSSQRLQTTARSQLLAAIRARGEMVGLAADLANVLVADPFGLGALPASLQGRVRALATAVLADLGSSLPLSGAGDPKWRIEPQSAFGFTPIPSEEYPQFLALDNDTMLYASAAFFAIDANGAIGAQMSPHVNGFYSPFIVDPQSGAPWFRSSVTELAGPLSAHTYLQVITPGRQPSQSRIAVSRSAQLAVVGRSVLSQAVIPIVSQAADTIVGLRFGDDAFWTRLIVACVGPTFESILLEYADGRSTAGAVLAGIFGAIKADLEAAGSGRSTLVNALLEQARLQLSQSAANALARQIVKRVTTFLEWYNWAVLSVDILSSDYDARRTPAAFDFEIDSGLVIHRLDPVRSLNYHWGTPDWDLRLRIIGRNMLPAGGFDAWDRDHSKVQVRIGRDRYPVDSLLVDGSSIVVVLERDAVEQLRSDSEEVSVLLDGTVESNVLELRVHDRPVIDRLDPAAGRQGDVIVVEGIGFDPTSAAANQVLFAGVTGPVVGESLAVSPQGTRLTVRVPDDAITGEVYVVCRLPDGFEVESNGVSFSMATSTITFWDSGNLKDDIFALWVDGSLLSSPATPVFPPVSVEVALAVNDDTQVVLQGIAAPDQIGTYSISFGPEVEVLAGSDPLTGTDLIRGATKTFWIRVRPGSARLRGAESATLPPVVWWSEGAADGRRGSSALR